MKALIHNLRKKGEEMTKAKHTYHISFVTGHAAYFALVFIEGHGFYAITAGLLFGLSIIGSIFHWSGE